MTPRIVCVMKSGGDYLPEHVATLYRQCLQYVQGDFHFHCMTDVNLGIAGVDEVGLEDNLPGWWSKLELFREFDSAFYMDLDTVLVGDITHMVQPRGGFWALRDFGSQRGNPRLGSGVMQWGKGFSRVYQAFMEAPALHMERHQRLGDQNFIERAVDPYGVQWLQDLWPGQLRSYKWDVVPNGLTPETRVVCFHGNPRPWAVAHHLERHNG